ncbi:MAG: FmdB family zinc ribbon protein [Bacillota bacterium]|nr:FmdB family zinc ribbon protein [Bacillota bacterium]
MPNYEYICRDCGKIFEITETLAEKEKGTIHTCPECKSKKTIQYFGNSIVIGSTHLH